MKKLDRKDFRNLIILAISFVVAIITICIMDFAPFGVPKITKITGKPLIDATFYSGEGLYDYLSNFNDDATHALLLVHGLDFLFMASVFVFEFMLVIFLSKKDKMALVLASFAFLELLFDITENLLVDLVVRLDGEKLFLANVASGATVCKWVFTGLFVLCTFITILVFVIKHYVKKHKNVESVQNQEDQPETSLKETQNTAENQ